MVNKVAFIIPTYPPHFNFAKNFLDTFRKNYLNLQADLFFIFSNESEAQEFGEYEYKIILPDELRIFEKQPVALFHHTVRVSARRQEAAYLRGCQQLLDKMGGELAALCNMDSSPVPDDEMLARLKEHGIAVPEDLEKYGYCSEVDTAVMNFHVGNLLDAYDYLSILHHG